MPPKKTKNQQPSSSQPLPQTRTSKKRKASDASNISEGRASSQPAPGFAAPAKRPRKAKAASVEPTAVIEEEQQEIALAAPTCDGPKLAVSEDTIEVSQPKSRHVHFDGPSKIDTDVEISTATNITPHPRKTSVSRRVTLSPSVGLSKRVNSLKTTTRRTSLPPTLSQNGDGNAQTVIQELQFSPLRTVLDERVRRRLKRSHLSEEQNAIEAHEKRDSRTQQELEALRESIEDKDQRMKDLMLELEMQRQLGIDVSDETTAEHEKTKAMEAELAALKRELAESNQMPQMDGGFDVAMSDDDMLVLNSQEHIVYPSLPANDTDPQFDTTKRVNGKRKYNSFSNTSNHEFLFSEEASEATLADPRFEAERKAFEEAILALSREANDAKAALQILTIELQSLGFAEGGASTETILRSIRQSFQRVREGVESAIPGEVDSDATNEDLIDALARRLEEYASRVRDQDEELGQKHTLINELASQIDGLLDRLADADIRKSTLEKQWKELDEAGEAKERNIEELEEELADLQEAFDSNVILVEEKMQVIKDLETENADSNKNVEKLGKSLQTYRNEEARLSELITKMEEEHRTTVSAMNKEREQTVGDLETQLDDETVKREAAEADADAKQVTITELGVRVEATETDIDNLRTELAELKADRDAELAAREQAEADVEAKEKEVEDLEQRVTRLEEQLLELNTELDTLRGLNESERHQREAAEADLDDRNVTIADLNQKLHEQGLAANKLRQKMFQVQQDNNQKVKELEEEMSSRDEQYQTDVAEEIDRREEADKLAADRLDSIGDLEEKLDEIENRMKELLAERDERIAILEPENQQKDGEIERLTDDLRSAQETHNAQVAQSAQRIEDAEGSIASLQQTIDLHEAVIAALRTEAENAIVLHNSEMEGRNAAIADLNHRINGLQSEIANLQAEKNGLERRVESEAEQMLELSATKDDEIDALKSTILDKQAKIMAVQEKADEADRAWTDVLHARDEEIAALKATTTTTEETVTTLTSQNAAIKERFRAFVAHSASTIADLQDQLRMVKTGLDEAGDELKDEGQLALEEMEGMDVVGEMKTVATTTTTTQHSQVRKTKGRKKRVVDSGIGIEQDEEAMAA